MRVCAYDGGRGQFFVTLVRTYYLNDPLLKYENIFKFH